MLAQTLIKYVSDAVMVVDDSMQIIEVNEPACTYLQAKREELLGKRPNEVVAQPDPERINQFWDKLLSGGEVEGQLPALREDGQVLNIEYKAFANVDPNRHMVIFREVSGQKRFEAQTQAFLKLGRQLSAATTAKAAAKIITNVADELLGWDACFLDLYSDETDTTEPLLTIDTLDGVRLEVPPKNFGVPTPVERKTIEEGKRLIFVEPDTDDHELVIVERPDFEFATVLFVPVRDGDRVIGVFSIQKYAANAYTYEDLETLQALADYAGGAFHRIQGEAQLVRFNKRLVVLREIEQAILEARSPEEIAEAALHRIQDVLIFDRGSVTLFDYLIRKGRLLAETGQLLAEMDQLIPETKVRPRGEIDSDLNNDALFGELLEDLRQKEYLLIDDVNGRDDYPGLMAQLAVVGLKSSIIVPLVAGNTLFGVLSLASKKIGAFSEEDAEVAGEVATSLAVALQNATLLLGAKEQASRLSELVDETRRRAEQMEVMVNISAAMRETQSRQELIPLILNRLMALSGAAGAAIALRSGEHLVFELSLGQWPQLAGVNFPVDEGITGGVLTTGKVFVSNDLSQETEFSGLSVFQETFAAVCLPLGLEENSLGVLWLVRHEPFSDDELRVMVAVADIVANALRRSFLYERVEEQARQVQQIVDTIPEGMLLLNEKRQIVLANPVAQTYLSQLAKVTIGDKLERLAGRPLEALLKPIVAGENWHELVVEQTDQTFEMAVQQTYGRLAGGWVLVIRDVTEERNQARYFQIQERLAVVGQLAAGIAHDFNNIMSVIILYSTMLGHNTNLSAKEKERLVVIHQQADRAAELIRQILDFSRQSVMKRRALNLRPFLTELVNLLERTLPETIRLELQADPGDLIIQGDPTRLQQAIMNLAVNARDAMPKGGTLLMTIKSKLVEPDDVPPLPDMEPGIWFEVKVEDSGMGIKPRHLPHLFEPFFTTKREGEGTGLGLAQVYGIVKQHNGYIDVSSRLRKGTTFYIYLPGVEMPRAEDASPEVAPIPEGMGQTILVVEDDNSAREALAEVLAMMDYQVLTATNGQEALDRFETFEGQIDLVLSDVVMPKMGGAALYAELKKRRPTIKMVVMSGYPQKDEEWMVLDEDIVHWVQKPFQVSTMVKTIKEALLEG